MAKNGFWNSVKQSNGVGDRLYNAEDLSFFYDLFFTNGIACNTDEMEDMFKVTLTSGSYTIRINEGVCIIGGKWHNGKGDSAKTLTMNTSHVVSSGMSRIDAVCIRKNDANRTFDFYIKEGTEAASPTVPAIDKDTELCLAYYTINSSYSVDYTSLVDTRHNSAFAGCAHLKIEKPAFDIAINEHITKTYYVANGINDNIVLSQLVQDYYKTETEKDLEIKVIGTIGLSGFAAGDGTQDNPRAVFSIGKDQNGTINYGKNKVVVDFLNCQPFAFSGAGTAGQYVVMFNGDENNIKNVRCCNKMTSTFNRMFYGHNNKAENCYLKNVSSGSFSSKCVEGSGTFANCEIIAQAANGAAYAAESNNEINGVFSYEPLTITGCTVLAENNSSATTEANGLYVQGNRTNSIILANNNEIGVSAINKTTNTYKINSGYYCITNNIVMKAGLVYEDTDSVDANNIIIPNLTINQSNYLF